MQQSLNILVIDDDTFSHKYIDKALKDQHNVITALNGEQGLIKAHEENPDIILLDVEMPGLNGYEVCDKIKHDSSIQHIPVIFLSANTSTRHRMQGYEVGADDYLVKPFAAEDLLAKIQVLNSYQEKQHELAQRIESATKTAFTAMAGSNELAQAISYIEYCYAAVDYPELAHQLFAMLSSFSLNSSLLIKTVNGVELFSPNGKVAPLESELMQKLHIDKRFIDFGCRTQINYPNCALLIKNMPLDDSERYGSLKDLLPVMLAATDTKIVSIRSEVALHEQNDNMILSFDLFNETLRTLGQRLTSNQETSAKILQVMVNTLTERLPSLGLEEDQEEFLLSIIDKAIIEIMELMRDGTQIDEIFAIVLSKLSNILDKQKTLLGNHEHAVDTTGGKQDNLSMDVELF